MEKYYESTNGDIATQNLDGVPLFCSGNSTLIDKVVLEKNETEDGMHLPQITDLDMEIDQISHYEIMSTVKVVSDSIGFSDNLFYIYTSGTTGLPKAAIIKHSKFILASIMCKHIIGLRENDVLYTAGLPLYHTLGLSVLPFYTIFSFI